MYLNLDLLYNINDYFFTLFFYEFDFYYEYENLNVCLYKVYSPMFKKSIDFFNNKDFIYIDYITGKYKNDYNEIHDLNFIFSNYQFTEKEMRDHNNNIDGYKCNPFYLDKKDLEFLTNNIRIN